MVSSEKRERASTLSVTCLSLFGVRVPGREAPELIYGTGTRVLLMGIFSFRLCLDQVFKPVKNNAELWG